MTNDKLKHIKKKAEKHAKDKGHDLKGWEIGLSSRVMNFCKNCMAYYEIGGMISCLKDFDTQRHNLDDFCWIVEERRKRSLYESKVKYELKQYTTKNKLGALVKLVLEIEAGKFQGEHNEQA